MRPFSLRRRLALGMGGVGLLAITAATVMIGYEYSATNNILRSDTLQGDAVLIAESLHWQPGYARPLVPQTIIDRFSGATRRFAILSDNGWLLTGSPGVTRPLTQADHHRSDDFFAVETPDGKRSLFGISMPFALPDALGTRKFWVQLVIGGDEDLRFDSLFEDFIGDIAWIWIPFILALIGVTLAIIHYGLRPLRRASAFAARIGPETVSIRLPEAKMPREVIPLVHAVNQALDRLSAGYEAQQAFIADTAHELRTPLAALKLHLALLSDRREAAALSADVDAMERLVNQLLDLARVGTIDIHPLERIDLAEISEDVAAHMGPLAIRSGRSIAVEGGAHRIEVQGSYDFLFRAIRNLVENALTHTPSGTTVVIEITPPARLRVIDRGPGIPPERRESIFQRFSQGTRDRSDPIQRGRGEVPPNGAGLGLAIVARTAAAHHAAISIADAPGGGAAFTLDFHVAAGRREAKSG